MSKLAGPSTTPQEAAPPKAPPPAYGAANMTDLEPLITWASCEVLNANSKTPLGNALKQGMRDQETLIVESDADEQLLLSVALPAPVKLHSIALEAAENAPKSVKLFINKPDMNFDDAEGTPCTQALDMTGSGGKYTLKFVSFQFVQHLTIFVSDNMADDEVTNLEAVRLYGQPLEAMNMSEFKRVG